MATAKPMTKAAVIEHMSKKLGTNKKLAKMFIEEFVALSYKEAKKSFVIPDLGKVVVVNRKKRKGRNPKTGETITIPARKSLKFRFSKKAKDAILGAK